MSALSARGYYTAIYSPMRRWHSLDEEMFQEVGVQQQVYPPDSLAPPESRQDLRAEWMKSRMLRDLATLELMQRDMRECLAHGRNFASVFLPQIGHLPYPDFAMGQEVQDSRTQARAVLEIEDAWLGELMDLLEQQHQLDDPVMVITGDHGIRTSEEGSHFVGEPDVRLGVRQLDSAFRNQGRCSQRLGRFHAGKYPARLARMAGLQQVAAAQFSESEGVRSQVFGLGRSGN